ncbi:MAG: hypothetical protein EZS28_040902 [Streblomastix strix]|uniref:Uncharacterized protein n=1 Tax=Streblomastix strix TaxID=222440 RepID=A0A5J4U083_9EUKA|nr:MAG: hypothetical protein EZS28_040902 [Streblomastix strix]
MLSKNNRRRQIANISAQNIELRKDLAKLADISQRSSAHEAEAQSLHQKVQTLQKQIELMQHTYLNQINPEYTQSLSSFPHRSGSLPPQTINQPLNQRENKQIQNQSENSHKSPENNPPPLLLTQSNINFIPNTHHDRLARASAPATAGEREAARLAQELEKENRLTIPLQLSLSSVDSAQAHLMNKFTGGQFLQQYT